MIDGAGEIAQLVKRLLYIFKISILMLGKQRPAVPWVHWSASLV